MSNWGIKTGKHSIKEKRILLIAANPADTSPLQLPREFREIEECIERTKGSDFFEIKQTGATRIRDLRRQLNSYKPHILHFSGHGITNGILLEDEQGNTQTTATQALAELIRLTNHNIECVILNACDSEASAKAISEHVDYAIGMNAPVGDNAAIEFALGFYDGIGGGCGYKKAYEFAENGFNHVTSQNQRSLKVPASQTSPTTQITSPKLHRKPKKQHYQEHQEHQEHQEQSNQTPWFHHTIDHNQLRVIDLFNKDDNLIFGHFIAKGSDAPESFVKHCYIEMCGGQCALEENIDQYVHHIHLNGADNNSFENSIFKQLQMDEFKLSAAQTQTPKKQAQDRQATIRHWLSDQRKSVVLYIPLSKEQQKNIKAIIEGAIHTLSALQLGNVKVLTLFRGSHVLPKRRWGIFTNKLPFPCLEMGTLRQLKKDDIYDWLDALNAKTQRMNHPEQALINMVPQEPFYYQDVLNHLRDIHHQPTR